MVCKGNNTSVIEALQDLPGTEGFGVKVDFSMIMSAINDKKLKEKRPELRAVLIDLLKGLKTHKTCACVHLYSETVIILFSCEILVMYVEVGDNRPLLEKILFSFVSFRIKLHTYIIMYYNRKLMKWEEFHLIRPQEILIQ